MRGNKIIDEIIQLKTPGLRVMGCWLQRIHSIRNENRHHVHGYARFTVHARSPEVDLQIQNNPNQISAGFFFFL